MGRTYFVKNPSGYYFAVANGRYGRFGTRLEAWALCESCKDNIVTVLKSVANNEEEMPVVEIAQEDGGWCVNCKARERRR